MAVFSLSLQFPLLCKIFKFNQVPVFTFVFICYSRRWVIEDLALIYVTPKETKELYTENYKTLMKEIKDDINREIFHIPE